MLFLVVLTNYVAPNLWLNLLKSIANVSASQRRCRFATGVRRLFWHKEKNCQPSLLMNRKILKMCRAFAQAAIHFDVVILEKPALSGSKYNAAERIRLTRPSQIHKVIYA